MRISKSKLNLYLLCPRKFKYKYIDHMEEDISSFAQVGLDVHEYAEHVAKELMRYDRITHDIVDKEMLKLYPYDDQDFDSDEHAQALLEFFYNIADNDYEIFSAEGDIKDDELNLRGIIDLILRDKKTNELFIIDYKTGKSRPISNYRIELCIYRRLVNYKYPSYKVSSACIYFTKDKQYRGFNFAEKQKKGSYVTEEDYDAVFELINYVRHQIDTDYFPPKVDPFFACKYCSFEDQCLKDGGR